MFSLFLSFILVLLAPSNPSLQFSRLSFSLSTRWKPQQNFVRDAPWDWSAQKEAEECRSVLLRLDDSVVERGSARFDIGVFPSNLSNRRRVVVQWCNRKPRCPMQFFQQTLKCISRDHRRYQISSMKLLSEIYRTLSIIISWKWNKIT